MQDIHNQPRGRFYFYMALVLLAIVVGGFSKSFFLRSGDLSELPLTTHLHGVCFVLWFVLFAVQSRLVASGRIKLHRTLGQFSALLAMGMVITASIVMRAAYLKSVSDTPAMLVFINLMDIMVFTAFYLSALLLRHSAGFHKRLMLFAGIGIILPAASRLMTILEISPFAALGLLIALLVAVIIFDLKTLRRVHKVSIICSVVVVLKIIGFLTIGQSQAWAGLVQSVLG